MSTYIYILGIIIRTYSYKILARDKMSGSLNTLIVTLWFRSLANRIEMISFGILIHNLKTDLQDLNHSNMTQSKVQTNGPKSSLQKWLTEDENQ